LTLNKGDPPLTTQALKLKLTGLWPNLQNWTVIPLGKGFFEFKFNYVEGMRRIWALGVMDLKPGILRFFCWTRDFTPQNQVQSHAQIWVRLLHLPQEYWRRKTLYEIASGPGTPLTIDRRFGLYARVLVDVDLSEKLFDSVMVEREGHSFPVSVQFERQPQYCAHCKLLGHSIQNCMKIGYTNQKEGFETISKKGNAGMQKTKNKAPVSLTEKQPAMPSTHCGEEEVTEPVSNLASQKDFDNEVVSIVDGNLMNEGVNVDETVGAVINKDMEADPSLTLHNSFHMLHRV